MPREGELERLYWVHQKEWYDIVGDDIVIKEGAPRRFLDSYELFELDYK